MTPCDRTENGVAVNGDLVQELAHTRSQRDECADRMDGVRTWRGKAIERGGDKPTNP